MLNTNEPVNEVLLVIVYVDDSGNGQARSDILV